MNVIKKALTVLVVLGSAAHAAILPAPPPVTSVAGRIGSVTLGTSDISGLGTIASQAASSVAITGGSVSGATGDFTTLSSTGSTTIGSAAATTLTISSDATTVTLQANSGSNGGINYNSRNSKDHLFNNRVVSPWIRAGNGNTTTLSGSTVNIPSLSSSQNLAGTSTIAGDQSIFVNYMSVPGDAANMSNGTANHFGVIGQMTTGWNGSRNAIYGLVKTGGDTTLTSVSSSLVGGQFAAQISHNAGGVVTGFGSTQMGKGVAFGANPRALIRPGGTYWRGAVGTEVGLSSEAPIGYVVGLQVVLESTHTTHGITRDVLFTVHSQPGASAGVRSGIEIGLGSAQWPIDPDGYLLRARYGQNDTTVPAVAAGGFDLTPVEFTGTGTIGGGFAFRAAGVSLRPAIAGVGGSVQTGYGEMKTTATGVDIDAGWKTLSGTPTINNGGANWVGNALAGDIYGNVVQVTTVASGVVTAITVKKRGWAYGGGATTAVSFVPLNTLDENRGSGLLLNIAWAGQTNVSIGGTSATAINIGRAGSATTINGTLWAGVTQGVTCSGAPTGAFASVNGIVTHC